MVKTRTWDIRGIWSITAEFTTCSAGRVAVMTGTVLASLEAREREVSEREQACQQRETDAQRREAALTLQERVYDERVIAAAAASRASVLAVDSGMQTDDGELASFAGQEWQRRLAELAATQEMLQRHEEGLDRRAGSISARERLLDETAQQVPSSINQFIAHRDTPHTPHTQYTIFSMERVDAREGAEFLFD